MNVAAKPATRQQHCQTGALRKRPNSKAAQPPGHANQPRAANPHSGDAAPPYPEVPDAVMDCGREIASGSTPGLTVSSRNKLRTTSIAL